MPNRTNNDLKPMLVSASDVQGGANRAAYRLHQGLRHIDVESSMLVFQRQSGDPDVNRASTWMTSQKLKLAAWMDKRPLEFYRQRDPAPYWSLNWFPNALPSLANAFNPNIFHIHWVGDGFLPIQSFKRLKGPLVWTLHDMWAMTGGCHYSGECTRYRQGCGHCPQLNSKRDYDLSRWTLERKEKHWRKLDFVIVTPSHWLAECARASRLFHDTRVEVIPNGLDLSLYKPYDKMMARDILGLPKDKKLILAGANEGLNDRRKGGQFLTPALHKLAEHHKDEYEIVIFGTARPKIAPDLGLNSHYTGHLQDDYSLVLLYSAVDVFVAPSVQDNLPNTIMEAMACGIPCVAFNIGGIPDMINHQENGYLAAGYDVDDLKHGIQWTLEDPDRRERLALSARQSVEKQFELKAVAQRYADLYKEILQ